MRSNDEVVFGYAARAPSPAEKKRMSDLARLLGERAEMKIAITACASYEQLAKRVYKRAVDVAWLPPLPFIALDQKRRAVPLVTHHRGGTTQFHAVIIVRDDARIRSLQGLRGKRAAWVDLHSASGFVIPRAQLAALGVDPRTAFARERFYGSHEAVVRAVVGGRADFGATYARLDRSGEVVHGPWSELPGAEESVRVLAAFGRIPSDVIVARADLDDEIRKRFAHALVAICHDVDGGILVRELFGVHEFRAWKPEAAARYESLRGLAASALESGLLDAAKIAAA